MRYVQLPSPGSKKPQHLPVKADTAAFDAEPVSGAGRRTGPNRIRR
jgi:hypothetical protein